MKRAIETLQSLFSPTKRLRSETPAKPSVDINSQLDELERIQSVLLDLDKSCCEEQLVVQRKYDLQKNPHFETRRETIKSIPNFWATAIKNHPSCEGISGYELEILQSLEDITINDNLDSNGSYEIVFSFTSNSYFSESKISRKIIFGEQLDILRSPLNWAPGKKPPHSNKFSLFHWITNNTYGGVDDFGETLRRDLWQNPYPYFLDLAPNESRGS
jgi:hypothetical protein